MKILALDFETEAIVNGAPKPPKPVGVSLKRGKAKSHYYSWEHPEGNNCVRSQAMLTIFSALSWCDIVVCHNAKFDIAVADYWMDSKVREHCKVADTMIMAFLCNPYEQSLALKTLADKYLGWPSSEQEDLRDWIIASVPEASAKDWGAYISKAPAELVAPYARGDTDRTYDLYCFFLELMENDQ